MFILDENSFLPYVGFNFHNEVSLYSLFFNCLIMFSILIILYSSYLFLEHHNRALMEFPIITLLAGFFLCCLVSANDLFIAFIATIGFSLNTYVLILANGDDKNCCEAAIKYFYLSAVSAGLIAFSL